MNEGADDEEDWRDVLLGGVPKSEIIGGARDSDPRLVDVVCSECHARLAKVTDGTNGPRLTVWAPRHMVEHLTAPQRAGVTRQRVSARAPENELTWLRDVGAGAGAEVVAARPRNPLLVDDESWERANGLYEELLTLTGAAQ